MLADGYDTPNTLVPAHTRQAREDAPFAVHEVEVRMAHSMWAVSRIAHPQENHTQQSASQAGGGEAHPVHSSLRMHSPGASSDGALSG